MEAAAASAAAEVTPSGVEAGGEITIPPQTRNKWRQRIVPLENKMEILYKVDEGVSKTDVGRLFGVSNFTVSTIKKNEKAI